MWVEYIHQGRGRDRLNQLMNWLEVWNRQTTILGLKPLKLF